MNNQEFTEHIREAFKNSSKYTLLKRTNIIDCKEEDIPETSACIIIASNKPDATKSEGTFEFTPITPINYPHIKIGVRLRDTAEFRLKITAETLAIGVQQRLNSLLTLYTLGGGEMSFIYLKSGAPSDIHTTVYSDDKIEDVKKHLKQVFSLYKVKYDRITLNSSLLKKLTGEDKLPAAKKKLKDVIGVKIDVDDSGYNERAQSGELVKHLNVPENKVIFSNSKKDNTDSFYIANIPINHTKAVGKYGIQGYIDGDCAYAVLRCIPILSDTTAFSSITFI